MELRRGHQPIPLQPKVEAVLRHRIEHADRAIARPELLAQDWPGAVVGDGALRRAISQLRQALGEFGAPPRDRDGIDHEKIMDLRGLPGSKMRRAGLRRGSGRDPSE